MAAPHQGLPLMRFSVPLAALLCAVAFTPTTALAQDEINVTGQYFGELRCGNRPRAELITLAEIGEAHVARVRTYPVAGGPYFQWYDAIYELEEQGDGAFASSRGAYIRGIEGDTAPPPSLDLQISADRNLTRLDSGAICGGTLPALLAAIESPSSFAEQIQGTVTHLTQDMRSFERVAESTIPNLFPAEILSVIDGFGAFMTMRVDNDERTCLFLSSPMGGMQIRRTPLHAVGSCAENVASFTERGPILMLDWGGGYRNGAGHLSTQDRRLTAFLSTLGAEPGSPPAGAAAGLAAVPGAIIPTVDRPADYPSAFAGMDWDIRGVPLGLDIQSTMAIAAPGQRLEEGYWSFERGTVFDREERRPQYDTQRIQLSRSSTQGGVADYVVIEPTDWHQGHMVHTVYRDVRARDLEDMPTVEALVTAVEERFGRPTSTSRFVYGAGGIAQETVRRMIYTIRGGEVRSVPCVPMDRALRRIGMFGRPNAAGGIGRGDIPEIERALEQIVERDCEGVLVIEYSTSGQNRQRVDVYRFLAVDLRLLLANQLSEFATRDEMREAAMEALPEVEPDL